MADDIIPIADLPTVTPGNYDYVVVAQNGNARKALAPEVTAAAAALAEALDGVVNEAETAAQAQLAALGYQPPVPYASGVDLTTGNQTVEYGGDLYAPVVAELPFTASGTFEAAKFRLIVPGQFVQSGTGAVVRTVQEKIREGVGYSVKDFGAVGDGVTDDTAAFVAAFREINAQGRGRLFIPKSTGAYRIKWSSAHLPFATNNNRFGIADCNGVEVYSDGATIKILDGARCGFTTGTAEDKDQAYGLYFVRCTNVTVRGITLDGNLPNLSIGTVDGAALGLCFNGCKGVDVSNVECYDFGTDGTNIQSIGNYECERVTFTNVKSIRSRRQGLSITGLKHAALINCEFSDTGQGAFSTAPKAGIDFEPISGMVCENVTLTNCRFSNNAGTALVCDAGVARTKNVSMYGGSIVAGAGARAMWVELPTLSLYDVEITGSVLNLAGRMVNCRITHGDAWSGTYALESNSVDFNPEVIGGSISVSGTRRAFYYNGASRSKTMRDVTINVDGDAVSSYVALINYGAFDNLTFNHTGAAPATPYYINVGNSAVQLKNSKSNSANIAFGSTTGQLQSLSQATTKFSMPTSESGSNLTIASGVVTATGSYHRLNTEASAAIDDLDTILGGFAGMRLTLTLFTASRDVVVKHGTGNIKLRGAADVTLGTLDDVIELIYNGTSWVQFK